MDRSAGFWNLLARRYSRQPIADKAAYQLKLDKTREYLRADMEVLELGCGTGGTAIIHAPHVRHIRAVDYSKNMIEIARQRAREAGVENVTFETLGIDAMAEEPGTYDAILALSVLHLVDDTDETIAKVHRMLKPGGVFVTNTHCAGAINRLFRPLIVLGGWLRLIPVLRFFTKQELLDSFTCAGFEIEYRWDAEGDVTVFLVATRR